MKILFDTHAFLWFLEGDEKLSEGARQQLQSTENVVLLSVASYWEICIKISIGKLRLADGWQATIDLALEENAIGWLGIEKSHLKRIIELPWHHRDPFDRLLVAQAIEEGCSLCSSDSGLSAYSVDVL